MYYMNYEDYKNDFPFAIIVSVIAVSLTVMLLWSVNKGHLCKTEYVKICLQQDKLEFNECIKEF